jgi:hypothetical protein
MVGSMKSPGGPAGCGLYGDAKHTFEVGIIDRDPNQTIEVRGWQTTIPQVETILDEVAARV